MEIEWDQMGYNLMLILWGMKIRLQFFEINKDKKFKTSPRQIQIDENRQIDETLKDSQF